MTSQREFLGRLIKALDDAKIPYMISGSMSSSFHGHPRATNDADIVICPTEEQLLYFIGSLGPGYYVSREAALKSLKAHSMFNVIDVEGSWKVDLVVRKERAYSREEFDRRMNATVMGMDVWVVTPEDCILSKLEWSKGRESPTQFDDALGVLLVQRNAIDFEYLGKWAKELRVEDSLKRLLEEAG